MWKIFDLKKLIHTHTAVYFLLLSVCKIKNENIFYYICFYIKIYYLQ